MTFPLAITVRTFVAPAVANAFCRSVILTRPRPPTLTARRNATCVTASHLSIVQESPGDLHVAFLIRQRHPGPVLQPSGPFGRLRQILRILDCPCIDQRLAILGERE